MEALEKAAKKQQTLTKATHKSLDNFLAAIQKTRERIQNNESPAEAAQWLAGLAKEMESTVTKEQKDLYNSASKVGKVLEGAFIPDLAAATRDARMPREALDLVVCEHLYRAGHFDAGDAFAREAGISQAQVLRAPYEEMHRMLQSMRARDLDPALQWCQQHRAALGPDRHLEFMLRKLQFLHLLQNEGRSAALRCAQQHFGPLAESHLPEIRRLMGSLLFAGRLERSPYAELLSSEAWEDAAEDLLRHACALVGQSSESPLLVAVAAGSWVLPTLVKMSTLVGRTGVPGTPGRPPAGSTAPAAASTVAAAAGRGDGPEGVLEQLPVELELGKEFLFRSVFSCPVSRDQSSPDNPPMLLTCGHVLCKESMLKLARGMSRTFKCPYCPVEASEATAKEIHFPNLEQERLMSIRHALHVGDRMTGGADLHGAAGRKNTVPSDRMEVDGAGS
ncbi:unnamed protein product [Pedinophyceae sp. YPF-701]|nr:unnamed protein product [Pedinophyceae sp. YPF-701]